MTELDRILEVAKQVPPEDRAHSFFGVIVEHLLAINRSLRYCLYLMWLLAGLAAAILWRLW